MHCRVLQVFLINNNKKNQLTGMCAALRVLYKIMQLQDCPDLCRQMSDRRSRTLQLRKYTRVETHTPQVIHKSWINWKAVILECLNHILEGGVLQYFSPHNTKNCPLSCPGFFQSTYSNYLSVWQHLELAKKSTMKAQNFIYPPEVTR